MYTTLCYAWCSIVTKYHPLIQPPLYLCLPPPDTLHSLQRFPTGWLWLSEKHPPCHNFLRPCLHDLPQVGSRPSQAWGTAWVEVMSRRAGWGVGGCEGVWGRLRGVGAWGGHSSLWGLRMETSWKPRGWESLSPESPWTWHVSFPYPPEPASPLTSGAMTPPATARLQDTWGVTSQGSWDGSMTPNPASQAALGAHGAVLSPAKPREMRSASGVDLTDNR